jgi:hypothetical protein
MLTALPWCMYCMPVQTNIQGRDHIYSLCDYTVNPALAHWTCIGLRSHSTILSRLFPKLLYGATPESATAVRNN